MSELTKKQFDLIAKLIQSKEPARTAAYLVLVKGKQNKDAAIEAGISSQSASNTVGRFRRTHKDIRIAYKIDLDA